MQHLLPAGIVAGLRQLAGQPILHFMAIGIAVFAFFSWMDEAPSERVASQIVVTQDTARRLAEGFEATWRRSPTREELDGLIEDHIREEIYVREALALGLDRDDTVIRRRLRQKMEFLVDSAAGALEPSERELRDHFEAFPDRFAPTPQVAFEQVFLGEAPAPEDVEAAKQALNRGVEPGAIGRRSLLPARMLPSPPAAVDGTFGRGFFEAVAMSGADGWSGPVASGFGLHLVKLNDLVPAASPPFETVRPQVLSDWQRARAEEIGEQQFEQLRQRYEILRPDRSTLEAGP